HGGGPAGQPATTESGARLISKRGRAATASQHGGDDRAGIARYSTVNNAGGGGKKPASFGRGRRRTFVSPPRARAASGADGRPSPGRRAGRTRAWRSLRTPNRIPGTSSYTRAVKTRAAGPPLNAHL